MSKKIRLSCRGCNKSIEVPYKPKGKSRKGPVAFMKFVNVGTFNCSCKPTEKEGS